MTREGLDRILRRALVSRMFHLGTLFAARALLCLAAWGLAVFAADAFLFFSQDLRRALWFAGWGLSAAGALSPWKSVSFGAWTRWRPRALALDLGVALRPADAFVNAWELSGSRPWTLGLSRDLADRAMADLEGQLARVNPWRILRPGWWKFWSGVFLCTAVSVGVLAAALPVSVRGGLWRAFFPFGAEETAGGMTVLPGDAAVVWGEDAAVEVRLADQGPEVPALWVKTDAAAWSRRDMSSFQGGAHRAVLRGVVEPVSYKVSRRGRWTRTYVLRPFRPPRWTDLRVEVRYPSYTGKPPETLEASGGLRALKGARILVRGRLDPAPSSARAVFDGRETVPLRLEKDGAFSYSWEIRRSGAVVLFVSGVDIPETALPWPLEALPDDPPVIRVLAPAQDLLVSPGERLPVVYEASDDFGLSEVCLNYRVGDGAPRKVPWRRDGPGPFEELWSLAELGLRPGDTVRYYLSALDNNTIDGPGEGRSAAFSLQAASYEREHERLEEGLKAFRRDLLDALAEETLVRSGLDASPPDWPSLDQRQPRAERALDRAAARMEQLAKDAEDDPLADPAAWAEHAGVLENLRDLRAETLPRAARALARRDASAASSALDEAVSELERLSLLSEDASKAARMRSLLSSQGDAAQSAKDMVDDLSSLAGGRLSSGDQEKMRALLNRMAGSLRVMAEQIQKLPQLLPEDFVNQEGIKTLRLEETLGRMAEVQAALARGDGAAALAAARRLVEEMESMQDALERAASAAEGGNAAEGLSEEVLRLRESLRAIVARQESLHAAARGRWEEALKRRTAAQERLLETMAAEHAAMLEAVGGLESDLAAGNGARFSWEERSALARAKSALSQAREEFLARRAREAPRLLERAAADLESLEKSAVWSEEQRGRLARLKEGVSSARSALLNPAPEESFLSEEEKAASVAEAPGQEALGRETLGLRTALQDMARRTATLSARLARRLHSASLYMDEASRSLSAPGLRGAVDAQEAALRELRDGEEEMAGAAGAFGGGSRPSAGTLRSMPAAGAAAGVRTGPVRIPRADEYKPPAAFREDILRAMKEKYPKEYERLIGDYYKKWAK